MTLSIIIPVYNEIIFIDDLLKSLLVEDIEKEILLVDGGSTDGTRERITDWIKQYPFISIIDNPQRFVSPGFNKAFKQSKGKYVAFIGAHAEYSKNYFSTAIQYLSSGECDAIGGPLKQAGKSQIGKSIAYCMSSKFGVGNTEFRTSVKKQYVQSVAFAVYSREVFEKTGLLDETLIRNQDDEFHYRMNHYDFRILMVPEMSSIYYVRESLNALAKQYYQYGLFKPLVLRKVKSQVRMRHLIPAFFTSYILLLIPLIMLKFYAASIPLLIYILSDIYFSFNNHLSLVSKFYCLLGFPLLHLSYGSGFLAGLSKR